MNRPIPSWLPTTTLAPSNDDAILLRCEFDAGQGNYRRLGALDWDDWVGRCVKNGEVGKHVPKVFFDPKRHAVSEEVNRMRVLEKLVGSDEKIIGILGKKDRELVARCRVVRTKR